VLWSLDFRAPLFRQNSIEFWQEARDPPAGRRNGKPVAARARRARSLQDPGRRGPGPGIGRKSCGAGRLALALLALAAVIRGGSAEREQPGNPTGNPYDNRALSEYGIPGSPPVAASPDNGRLWGGKINFQGHFLDNRCGAHDCRDLAGPCSASTSAGTWRT